MSDVADDDSEGLANEPEDNTSPVEFVEPSGMSPEDDTPAVDEAPDVTKDVSAVTAANAETPAAKPPMRVSGLMDFFIKRSTTVRQIHEAMATRHHTSRLSDTVEKQVNLSSNTPKLL